METQQKKRDGQTDRCPELTYGRRRKRRRELRERAERGWPGSAEQGTRESSGTGCSYCTVEGRKEGRNGGRKIMRGSRPLLERRCQLVEQREGGRKEGSNEEERKEPDKEENACRQRRAAEPAGEKNDRTKGE